MLDYTNKVLSSVSSGSNVDVVYYDVAKAFDTVSHDKVLHILAKLGVRGNLWCWISSFLKNRSCKVNINGSLSSSFDVISGVPQGSVLGPILFLIYLFDLPKIIPSCLGVRLYMFADDLKMLKTIQTDSDTHVLQACIDSLVSYMTARQLKLSPTKTRIMHFGKTNPCHCYTLYDQTYLETTETMKD